MDLSRLNVTRKRTPMIRQSEVAECGLACMAMIAGHYGNHVGLTGLRQRFGALPRGSTFAEVARMSEELGIHCRGVQLECSDISQLRLPAVVCVRNTHFVVVVEWGRRILIHDPMLGVRRYTEKSFAQLFSGYALEFEPGKSFKTANPGKRLTLFEMLGPLPGGAAAATQLLFVAFSLQIFLLGSPFFLQLVMDNALVSADRELLTVLAVGFLVLAMLQLIAAAVRSWMLMYIGTALNLQLTTTLFRHLIRLPMTFFGGRHLGDIVSRFQSADIVQRTLTANAIEVLIDGVMAIGTLVLMLVYSPSLAGIACGAASLYAITRIARYRMYQQCTEEQILCSAKQNSHFLETVRGMQSIKVFNRESQRSAAWHNLFIDTTNANFSVQRLGITFQAISTGLFSVENIVVVWVGALLVLDSTLSIGMLVAFISYKQQFSSRMGGLIDKAIELRMLGLYTDRMAEIALSPLEQPGKGARPDCNAKVTLAVNNLSHRYGQTEGLTLEGVSLKVEKGESVAIVGASGCGKTTLLKAMLGLISPTSGVIAFGGVDIRDLGGSKYRENVAAVLQDDQLFAGSIADNIAFFEANCDLSRLEACAELACIHEDIMRMPMGYATAIGDMGTTLSGGQKQRLLIARALYRDPQVLFLDEATSHLDVDTERRVNANLRRLKMTRVFVAHRPDAIASADKVIRIENGGVVQEFKNIRSDIAAEVA